MTTKNTTQQQPVNASYVLNPAKGEIKMVIAAKQEVERKVSVKPNYVKTHYSIDTNGGGYTGL